MGRRGGAIIVSILALGLAAVGMMLGCQSGSSGDTPNLAQQYFSLSVPPEEWLPIIEEIPPEPGDIRNLENCAEKSFAPPPRGPWEKIDNQKLAGGAKAAHRTTDQLVRVGESISFQAEMKYDGENLSHEWVRLFIGACDKWTQVADRKTDASGRVSFRGRNRMPAGVYGVVFQVVGDGSVARGELWVMPRETEIVAMELQGGAFDDLDEPRTVSRADELARLYASRGNLVAFVDLDAAGEHSLEDLRKNLRREGFPVGPVVRALSQDPQPVANTENAWGQANNGPAAEAAANLTLSTFYGADSRAGERLSKSGINASTIITRDQCCGSFNDGEPQNGWGSLIDELVSEKN